MKPTVEPYEGNIVRIVTIGTWVWALTGLALLPFWTRLDHDGHLWWIATCACGVAFGLLGRWMCVKREAKRELRA